MYVLWSEAGRLTSISTCYGGRLALSASHARSMVATLVHSIHFLGPKFMLTLFVCCVSLAAVGDMCEELWAEVPPGAGEVPIPQ